MMITALFTVPHHDMMTLKHSSVDFRCHLGCQRTELPCIEEEALDFPLSLVEKSSIGTRDFTLEKSTKIKQN